MAYNKAREEKKWRLWKEAEEKQLRSLGVSEKDIEKLRVHDWAIFNSDRRYYQRMQETGTYLEEVAADITQPEIKTVEDFLDNIENQQLYQVLIKVDRLTLRIAFMKVQGYSTREIASYLRITEKAVYRRLDRLKEKIQKIAERLITEKNVTEFWVGNYGGFDTCAASAVRELKLKYPDVKLILVIPYFTKKIEGYRDWYEKNYDKIMLADIPVTTPGKYKIIKANEYMVENSDFLICYIDHTWGGSYKTYS